MFPSHDHGGAHITDSDVLGWGYNHTTDLETYFGGLYHPLWDYDYGDLINTPTVYSLTQIATNIGNWSADKPNYALTSYVDTLGNWSADSNSYYTTTQIDNQFASLPNLTLSDISSNIGNWSADSSSYSTTSQANDLYADDGANADITSMTGLTGEVKTSSYTNYTQTDGNVQYFSQGCVMKSNSTGIYFIC